MPHRPKVEVGLRRRRRTGNIFTCTFGNYPAKSRRHFNPTRKQPTCRPDDLGPPSIPPIKSAPSPVQVQSRKSTEDEPDVIPEEHPASSSRASPKLVVPLEAITNEIKGCAMLGIRTGLNTDLTRQYLVTLHNI